MSRSSKGGWSVTLGPLSCVVAGVGRPGPLLREVQSVGGRSRAALRSFGSAAAADLEGDGGEGGGRGQCHFQSQSWPSQELSCRGLQGFLGGDDVFAVFEAAAEVEESGVVEEGFEGGEEGGVFGVEVGADLLGEGLELGLEGVGEWWDGGQLVGEGGDEPVLLGSAGERVAVGQREGGVEERLLLVDVVAEGGVELGEEDGAFLGVVVADALAAFQQRLEPAVVLPDQSKYIHRWMVHRWCRRPNQSQVLDREPRRRSGGRRYTIERSEDHGAYGAMVSEASDRSTRS